MHEFDVSTTADGKIVDFVSGESLASGPEEVVRQRFLRALHYEYQYPVNLLGREVSVRHGSHDLVDAQGNPVRADIVVYKSATAAANRDQASIRFVVECKKPDEKSGYNQLVSYIFNTGAEGGVWFNGGDIQYYRRLFDPSNDLVPWTGIPRPGEAWDALGRRRKDDLVRPKDIKGLLRRCHNRLHGRGADGEDEDLTMDMVRLILAKAMDEEKPGELPEFYCSPEEYMTDHGRDATAQRVHRLFSDVVRMNSEVFGEHERISVGSRAIADVVTELQRYRLLSDLADSQDWDLMGHAYEEYTAAYLKQKRGQFFTNRLIVDLMVAVLDPDYQDVVLDLAGGSGGFLTGTMRFVRRRILDCEGSAIGKQRQLDRHRTRLFMVEISKRLVKVAKTAMILNGDGHTGMTQGDSLGPYEGFDDTIIAMCSKGKPTVILTNPPFAGVGEGRVTDADTLDRFTCGKRWAESPEGYRPMAERLREGAPPEMLFFERCPDWLAPGGRLGIVLPKSFLDTATYRPARTLLFNRARLLAVVNCHKNVFQPHTGVRTSLVFLEKRESMQIAEDYPIFMAISRKCGQDSEGVPIFKRDKLNRTSDELDEDLTEILADYRQFRHSHLEASEYRFSISRSDLDEQLRINPQLFLPNLNETLRRVESIDNREGWSVTTLGQIMSDVQIFKGPRFKSENLIVDTPEIIGAEPYYTPSAILQEESESVKYVRVPAATPSQLRTIAAIRVNRGDIVITRSGTIGRVAYITKKYDGAIVSDDLIRVHIPGEVERLWVWAFLKSHFATDQMLRNEYGAVQQHLEPNHISNLLIPVPDSWSQVDEVIQQARCALELKESLEGANLAFQFAADSVLAPLTA